MLKVWLLNWFAYVLIFIPLVGFASPLVLRKAFDYKKQLLANSGKNIDDIKWGTLNKIEWWISLLGTAFYQFSIFVFFVTVNKLDDKYGWLGLFFIVLVFVGVIYIDRKTRNNPSNSVSMQERQDNSSEHVTERTVAAGPYHCAKCGTIAFANTKFCGKCGNPLGTIEQKPHTKVPETSIHTPSPQTVEPPVPTAPPARAAAAPSRKKIFVAAAVVITVAGTGVAVKMFGDYQTFKQQRIAENERIAMDQPREMAKRIAEANEKAEQHERRNRAEEEDRRRREAEVRRETEIRAQQQAQLPAPIAQPAPDLLTKAAQCGDTSACAAIMLEGIDPRKPEVISVAATRISEANKAQRGDRKQARALNAKALGELKSNNYAAAIDLLKQALAVDPADVEIVANLGYACLQANNFSEAERALIGALQLDPKRTSAWAPYAELFAARGDSSNAVRALLLGYEFSGNRDKTMAVFEDKSNTATREVMRPVFAAALQKIRSGLFQ